MLYNANRGKNSKVLSPEDFVPSFIKEPKKQVSKELLMKKIEALKIMFG